MKCSPRIFLKTCKTPGRTKGFSLVEMLVAISIVSVLAVLSLSAFKNVLAGSHLAKCASNLREWGRGFQLYMNDHDGYLPQQAEVQDNADTSWQELIAPYIVGNEKNWNQRNVLRARFRCPGDKSGGGIVYGSTHYLSPLRNGSKSMPAPKKLASINPNQKLSDTLLLSENYTGEFWDTRAATSQKDGGKIVYLRHKVGGKDVANFLFADFHVEPLTYQQTLERPVICAPLP